jgi:cysteine desulfuration protein SufE
VALRPELQAIVNDFAESPKSLRLAMLLEFADGLPELPERLREAGVLDQVHECQTPFFVAAEQGDSGTVELWFDAPPEAPTTRGYAGVLRAGLSGATPTEILATPANFFTEMSLSELISPLRLRGMSAILAHIKRQVVNAQP